MIPVMRPLLGAAEADALAEVISSGWVAQGPKVAEFERRFAEYIGTSDAVAVSSCTAALHLALYVLGVGPGDEVIVPSFSFIASTNAVRYCGATPVFADVDPVTGNLTPDTVAPLLTDRTRAVMAVHQGGLPADVDALRAACGDVPVVEDAACAVGSTYRGRSVGAGARLAAWSFHPRKLLTTGEGGMVTTDDPALAARLRRLREHGMNVSAADRHKAAGKAIVERYLEVGFNYRMTDLQAAIGIVQLGRLPDLIVGRRAMAARYHELLRDLPGVRAATDPGYGTTNYQSFWVLLGDDVAADRNDVLATLADAGVSARRGIMAAHTEPAYEDTPHGPLPVTELLTNRSLILPLHHELTPAQQDLVVRTLATAIGATVSAAP